MGGGERVDSCSYHGSLLCLCRQGYGERLVPPSSRSPIDPSPSLNRPANLYPLSPPPQSLNLSRLSPPVVSPALPCSDEDSFTSLTRK